MIVNPKLEATLWKLVCVVEPVGTYTVLVVPDLLVTKFVTVDTDEEPIWIVKSVNEEQYLKQALKLVTAVLYLNKSCGIDVNPVQLQKQLPKSVAEVLYLNKSCGIDVNLVQL